ncbi:MAG: HAD family hydrolase [Desulfobacteraceae bacterium]|nr:MAG: HAD family hydrolase [Desulfobacteraceae bacterium]
MKRPAVFLDRDGTINEQMGYINHRDRFILLPRAAEAIKLLNQNHFPAIIVTNQSGVARGYYPIGLVYEVHALLKTQLARCQAGVDGIYFCPHYTQGKLAEYAVQCNCRKPAIGLIEQACQDFEIDLIHSYMIGDTCSDMELAHNAGLKGIMVRTGYGMGEIDHILPQKKQKPSFIAQDLYDAVQWLLADCIKI